MYLLITAHPDDESIFFAGVIQKLRRHPWHIICVTDGNADRNKKIRSMQFQRACHQLGVQRWEQWNFPDEFKKRLNTDQLMAQLKKLQVSPRLVFSHSPIGEYGHPHHQDVSYAVHQVFHRLPVWSPAMNAFAEKNIHLNREQYAIKMQILSQIYFSETKRFFNLLSTESWEGYHRVSVSEVQNLYAYFTGQASLSIDQLKAYRHLYDYLRQSRDLLTDRPF